MIQKLMMTSSRQICGAPTKSCCSTWSSPLLLLPLAPDDGRWWQFFFICHMFCGRFGNATFLLNQIFHGSTFFQPSGTCNNLIHLTQVQFIRWRWYIILHGLLGGLNRSFQNVAADRPVSMAWEWGSNTCLMNMGFMNFPQVELKSESFFFGGSRVKNTFARSKSYTTRWLP